jgi:hypothetical protein
MFRFIFWFITVVLAIGFGPQLVTFAQDMAKSAILTHARDQMSYAKFTRKLLTAKPRVITPKEDDSDLTH